MEHDLLYTGWITLNEHHYDVEALRQVGYSEPGEEVLVNLQFIASKGLEIPLIRRALGISENSQPVMGCRFDGESAVQTGSLDTPDSFQIELLDVGDVGLLVDGITVPILTHIIPLVPRIPSGFFYDGKVPRELTGMKNGDLVVTTSGGSADLNLHITLHFERPASPDIITVADNEARPGEPFQIMMGEPLNITWEPDQREYNTRIEIQPVEPIPVRVTCQVEDTGVVTLPDDVITGLYEHSNAHYYMIRIIRTTTSTYDIDRFQHLEVHYESVATGVLLLNDEPL